MIFDKLCTWRQWQYLPLIDRLMVFDKTGQRVAEWFVENGTIHRLVNTIPDSDRYDFALAVDKWMRQVKTLGV
jgi:hypothetical protein